MLKAENKWVIRKSANDERDEGKKKALIKITFQANFLLSFLWPNFFTQRQNFYAKNFRVKKKKTGMEMISLYTTPIKRFGLTTQFRIV